MSKKTKPLRKMVNIKKNILECAQQIADLTEEFSSTRFDLLDRAEAGDVEAKDLYEGWTRIMHLHLGNAMEFKP